MSSTKIFYYLTSSGDNPFSDFLDSLNESQQSKVLRIFKYIEEYGLSSVLPHIKKLSNSPFWEIRILGKDNIRVVYVAPNNNSILVIHGFVKKTKKTSSKDLKIAFLRFKEWQNRR